MSHSKMVVGAIATLIVSAAGAGTSPVPAAVTASEDGSARQFVLSDEARDRVLDEAGFQHATVRRPFVQENGPSFVQIRRPFLQENGPTFVQWRGQVKHIAADTSAGPSGDVLLAFADSRNPIA